MINIMTLNLEDSIIFIAEEIAGLRKHIYKINISFISKIKYWKGQKPDQLKSLFFAES